MPLTGREIDIECIINLHKSIYGVKPRTDFDLYTDDQLTQMIIHLDNTNHNNNKREENETN